MNNIFHQKYKLLLKNSKLLIFTYYYPFTMSTGIRDELLVLKGKLELLEKELTDQMMELEVKAEKWAKVDEGAELLIKTKNSVLFLDVGGKKFQTKLDTLLSIRDTLFY